MHLSIVRVAPAAPESSLARMIRLSPIKARIADLLVDGKQDKEIARAVGRSRFTVRDHLRVMQAAAGGANRVQLAVAIERDRRFQRMEA